MLRVAMAWRQGQSYSEDLRARVLVAIDGGLAVRVVASAAWMIRHFSQQQAARGAAQAERRSY